ncbi:MAG TPA: DoxX family protein [Haliangiales bacterium]|nr:DoxX family protein [Haliangiales bacterium]
MRDDLGKLILRIAIGGLLLLHGISKITHGIGWLHGMLDAKGWPTFLAYGAYVGEVVAPVLVILGLLTRLGGIIIFVHFIFAFLLVHTGQLGEINVQSGGWQPELPALFLLGGLAIFLLGPGKYAVGGRLA